MVSPSRRALVDELACFDRLLEIGIGRRPGVARAIASGGADVVAVDVSHRDSAGNDTDDRESDEDGAGGHSGMSARRDEMRETGHTAGQSVNAPGSLTYVYGDVLALAETPDPLEALRDGTRPDFDRTDGSSVGPHARRPNSIALDRYPDSIALDRLPDSIDAVYGLNLPAELQRATVEVADTLDAECLFTTLGFEEPVVPVRRRSIPGETVYVVDPGRRN